MAEMECIVKNTKGDEVRIAGQDLLFVLREKGPDESLIKAIRRVLYPKLQTPEQIVLEGEHLKKVGRQQIKATIHEKKSCHKEKESYRGWAPCERCWAKIMRQVFHQWGRYCSGCGSREKLGGHHVVPRTEGGTHDDTNIVPLCSECHDYIECHDSRPRTVEAVIHLCCER